jgi:hypothetical protein
MPLGSQPRRAQGTVEHPNSALGLRRVLAWFGLIVCIAGGIVVWQFGPRPFAVALFVLAATAVIDLLVITIRLRRQTRVLKDTR